MSNLWSGLKNAQVFERGNYFTAGIFDVRVIRCMVKQTMRSGLGFIAELEVLTSSSPNHAPGSTGTWFQGMNNQTTAFSAIKEFVLAIHGINPKDRDRAAREVDPYLEQWMAMATGAENSFAGKVCHLETFITKTREKQTDFTVHKWTPYDGDPALLPPRAFTAPAPAPAPAAQPGWPPPAPAAPPPAWAQSPGPVPGAPPAWTPPPVAWTPPPGVQGAPVAAPAAPPQGPPPQPVWDPQTGTYVLPRR